MRPSGVRMSPLTEADSAGEVYWAVRGDQESVSAYLLRTMNWDIDSQTKFPNLPTLSPTKQIPILSALLAVGRSHRFANSLTCVFFNPANGNTAFANCLSGTDER